MMKSWNDVLVQQMAEMRGGYVCDLQRLTKEKEELQSKLENQNSEVREQMAIWQKQMIQGLQGSVAQIESLKKALEEERDQNRSLRLLLDSK